MDEKKESKRDLEERTAKFGENIIKFSISGINETGLVDLVVGKYTLPAYILVNKTIKNSLILKIK